MPLSWIVLLVALWTAVIGLSMLVLGLNSRMTDLERRLPHTHQLPTTLTGGPAPGAPPPRVQGHEQLDSLPKRQAGRVVLFLSSTCGPCQKLAGELTAAQDGPQVASHTLSRFELIVVCDAAGASAFGALVVCMLITQRANELTRAWRVPGTPFAVAVDHTGLVRAARLVSNLEQLRDLAAILNGSPFHAVDRAVSGAVS